MIVLEEEKQTLSCVNINEGKGSVIHGMSVTISYGFTIKMMENTDNV